MKEDDLFDLVSVICEESGQISQRKHLNRGEPIKGDTVLVMQLVDTYSRQTIT